MKLIIYSYLIFNLIIGLLLLVYYFWKERSVKHYFEIMLLLFFPVIGLGLWKYRKRCEEVDEQILPLSWFVLDYMVKINWIYIFILPLIIIISIFGIFDYVGSGLEWAEKAAHPIAIGLGFLADIAIMVSLFIILLLVLIGYLFLVFLMIFIPKYILKDIESDFYRKQ